MIDKQYVEDFFNIASFRCPECNKLGVLVDKKCIHPDQTNDIPVELITTPLHYGIKSLRDWDIKMNQMMKMLKENKEEVLKLIPQLENDWPQCCDVMKTILEGVRP